MGIVLIILKKSLRRKSERMSDWAFQMMKYTFRVVDLFFPYVERRIKKFGIQDGMILVDYGCGPGRYTTQFASLVGDSGKVYAVDIHELAIDTVRKRIKKKGIMNIEPLVAKGYNSGIPSAVANLICALDMFSIIKEPTRFLKEIRRIIKDDGMFIVDDGHQPRSITRKSIADSALWEIVEDTRDHLKCRPLT